MSVAVANDKGVVFSSDADPGVHKFMGDQSAHGDKPVLPTSGGVAADHSSLRWAAAQAPNVIKVYEGQQFLKNLRLPPKNKFYKGGLMSFGPDGSLCVAVQDADNEARFGSSASTSTRSKSPTPSSGRTKKCRTLRLERGCSGIGTRPVPIRAHSSQP